MNPLNIIKSLLKIKVIFVESLKISGQRVKEKIKKNVTPHLRVGGKKKTGISQKLLLYYIYGAVLLHFSK